MRAALLGLLAACGAPAAPRPPAPAPRAALPAASLPPASLPPAALPPAAPPPVPAAPPALTPPPVALLGRAGTLHLVVPRASGAACEAWTVTPEVDGISIGALAHPAADGGATERLRYEAAGTSLWLTERSLGDGDAAVDGLACSTVADVGVALDGLLIGGARAFSRAEDCAAAVAGHARVALDLGACPAPRVTTAGQERAARSRLGALLARGGTAYALAEDAPTCLAVRARPNRAASRADLLVGELATRVTVDGRRGTSTYHYEYQPAGELPAGLGLSTAPTPPARGALIWIVDGITTFDRPGPEDVHGLFGCADPPAEVRFADDRAYLPDGATLYLTRAACAADARADRTRRAWIAPEPPDPDAPPSVTSTALPRLGGC